MGSSQETKFLVAAGIVLISTVWVSWKRYRSWRRHERDLAAWASTKVLDLRDEESFELGHLQGSYNITHESLLDEQRWFELPDKHEKLLVMLPPSPRQLASHLETEMVTRRCPGSTKAIAVTPQLLRVAERMGLVERGPPSPGMFALFTPCAPLARSANCVESQLRRDRLPLSCLDVGCGSGRDSVWLALRGWKVTGIDCLKGALQRTAQLAQRMGVSDRVTVLEGKVQGTGELRMAAETPGFVPAAVVGKMAAATGENAEKKDLTPCVQHLIEGEEHRERCHRQGTSTSASGKGSYSLVVVVRFLERNACDTLAQLVDPSGGYIFFSTFIEEEVTLAGEETEPKVSAGAAAFGSGSGRDDVRGVRGGRKETVRKGKERAAAKQSTAEFRRRWPHHSPKDPKKVLRRGELAESFGTRQGFEVVEDSVERLADGRPVSCFLARKTPQSRSSPSSGIASFGPGG
ncbi:unnamed protein product [Discosporangium mesarthrocarpum]